jgi:hypothetical protein
MVKILNNYPKFSYFKKLDIIKWIIKESKSIHLSIYLIDIYIYICTECNLTRNSQVWNSKRKFSTLRPRETQPKAFSVNTVIEF